MRDPLSGHSRRGAVIKQELAVQKKWRWGTHLTTVQLHDSYSSNQLSHLNFGTGRCNKLPYETIKLMNFQITVPLYHTMSTFSCEFILFNAKITFIPFISIFRVRFLFFI